MVKRPRLKHVWEPGVPAGWCVGKVKDKTKFHKGSFRTICYDTQGDRAKVDTGAVRCLTIGCPRGQKWNPKAKLRKFKTRGICGGGTRTQRMMYKPGHYKCSKVSKRRSKS